MLKLITCLLMAGIAAAAVPESIVKIKSVTIDEHKTAHVEYTLGANQKPIMAIVLEHVGSPGEVMFSMLSGAPLNANDSYAYMWPYRANELEVVAVEFADGTTMGDAVDKASGEDVLDEIAALRHAEALEWAKWRELVAGSKDPHEALAAFIKAGKAIAPVEVSHSNADAGRASVRAEIRAMALAAEAKLNDQDARDVHRALAGRLEAMALTTGAEDVMRRPK